MSHVPCWLDLTARLGVSHVSFACASLTLLASLWQQIGDS